MPHRIELLSYRIIINKHAGNDIPSPETTDDLKVIEELMREKYGKEIKIDFTYRDLDSKSIKTENDFLK